MDFPPLAFETLPGRTLSMLLFRDVTNAKELQQAVITGKIEPEASFINAAVVGGLLPLQVAAHKALAAHARGRMTTRLLHSELVFNLSPSKHISEGLKRYGIGEDTRHLLVARFDATPQEMEALRVLVKGTPAPMSDLEAIVDKTLLAKYLKLAPEELGAASLVSAAVSRIAAREVL